MLTNVKCFLSLLKAFVPAVVIALTASNTLAEVFWTQDFDSLNTGDIHGKGTTWEGTATAEVTTALSFSPPKSLVIGAHTPLDRADWYDDTPGTPHGGLMEFSWMVNRSTGGEWAWEVWGFGGSKVAEIRNNEVGSISTLDLLTDSGWVETLAIVPAATWSEFTMQVDLRDTQDQYRVRIGDGDWWGWYSLGTDEQYFRRIGFRRLGGNIYLDDMVGSVVPEPSAVVLLGIGTLILGLAFRFRRKRKL